MKPDVHILKLYQNTFSTTTLSSFSRYQSHVAKWPSVYYTCYKLACTVCCHILYFGENWPTL